jgi:hypothetical protein
VHRNPDVRAVSRTWRGLRGAGLVSARGGAKPGAEGRGYRRSFRCARLQTGPSVGPSRGASARLVAPFARRQERCCVAEIALSDAGHAGVDVDVASMAHAVPLGRHFRERSSDGGARDRSGGRTLSMESARPCRELRAPRWSSRGAQSRYFAERASPPPTPDPPHPVSGCTADAGPPRFTSSPADHPREAVCPAPAQVSRSRGQPIRGAAKDGRWPMAWLRRRRPGAEVALARPTC